MALLTCSECKGEISDKAISCPHCGNPVPIQPNPVSEVIPIPTVEPIKTEKNERFSIKRTLKITAIAICTLSAIVLVLFLLPSTSASMKDKLSSVSMFFIRLQNSPGRVVDDILHSQPVVSVANTINRATQQPQTPPPNIQANSDGSKIYSLEKNDIFGYQFYTGKIDQSGSIDIGSEPKQTIAKLLNYLTFPHALTKNLAIMNIDPAVAKPTDRLNIPWAGGSATVAIQPQAGTYQGIYGGSVIALNNLVGYNISVMTHELGHHIAMQMTDSEWSQYYKLRGIPSGTSRTPSNWNVSPNEDFAEVFKNTYRQGDSSEWSVRTEYGLLMPTSDFAEFSTPCYAVLEKLQREYIASHGDPNQMMIDFSIIDKAKAAVQTNAELQSCRRQNRSANSYGTPVYTVQVSEAARQFVRGIVARLNR